jgi:MYXO-CTERM domain-containing protein
VACTEALTGLADGVCAPLTGTSCSDGEACTSGDFCAAGICVAGADPCDASTTCAAASEAQFTCGACPAGTFSSDGTGATACTPWTECGEGEFLMTEGTSTSDAVCAPCSVCGPDQTEMAACTAASDTACAPAGSGSKGGCGVAGATSPGGAHAALGFALLGWLVARRRRARSAERRS